MEMLCMLLILQGCDVCRDASIYSAPEAQSKNFDGLTLFRANVTYRALIRFTLDEMPNDKAVKDAAIMLFVKKEYHDSPLTADAYAVNAEWREDEVTWLNRTSKDRWRKPGGDFAAEPVARLDIPAAFGKGWIVLRSRELTKLVSDWGRGRKPNHGLMLVPRNQPGGPSMKIFADSEDADQDRQPKLIVSYDGPIDPAKYGYVSDAELVRRPLRERLERLSRQVRPLPDRIKERIDSLGEKIERLPANQADQVEQLNRLFDQLRVDLIKHNGQKQNTVIWPIGPWHELLPDTIPRPSPVKLSVKMLQDEYAELSLAVTNASDRNQTLDVRVVGGGQFPPGQIKLRASYWVKAKPVSDLRGQNAPVWIDDALPRLDRDRYLTLSPGRTRRLWLTVDSANVGPGKHEFELIIASRSKEVIDRIPVGIEVLPLSLRRDPDLHVFTYSYINRPSTANCKQFAINDVKAHFQNTYVLDYYPSVKVDSDGKIVQAANFSPLDQWLDLIPDAKKILFFWCWDCGMSRETFGGALPWLSQRWRNVLKTWVRDWCRYLQSKGIGLDRLVMYPFDETYDNPILDRTEYQALEEIAGQLHQIDPGIKVFADPVSFGPADLQAHERLKSDIDVWSVKVDLLKPGDHNGWPHPFSENDKRRMRRFFRKEQQSGKLVWAYQCDGPMKALDVNDYYRRFAWLCWYNGITGLGIWSYNDIRGPSGWDDFDGDQGPDFAMIYEMRDAPGDIPRDPREPLIPSRRWQAWRAGVQDYLLLSQAARKNAGAPEQVRRIAEQVLAGENGPDVYEQAREKLLGMLLEGGY